MTEKMFNWDEEWNISFAGCGFRSIYYLGALSCIFERVPQLVQGASKICGASSGCLVAAALTVGIPIEQICADLLTVAKEARKHTLGVFHPTFSLLRSVRDTLLEKLPPDAHLRASGKLCVSLTRITDGKNVLVSEFDSREELIQVLLCSCFFPVYCGFIPPSYRGVLYMDGALSNNMPLIEHRNTITMAPFSGESDICPTEGTFNFFEVHYGNVSIQVNTGNVHRVSTSFLPPRIEKLAEICHNGYVDALRFLRERDLLGTQCLPPSLVVETDTVRPACCGLAKVLTRAQESGKMILNGLKSPEEEEHQWLDVKVIEKLPVSFKKVLCEACRDGHAGDGRWSHIAQFPPVKAVLYLLTLLTLPLMLTFSSMKSMISLGCAVISRLLMLITDVWSSGREDTSSVSAGQHRSSFSSGSDFRNNKQNFKNLHLDDNSNLDVFLLTATCSSPSHLLTTNTSAPGRLPLNHRRRKTPLS